MFRKRALSRVANLQNLQKVTYEKVTYEMRHPIGLDHPVLLDSLHAFYVKVILHKRSL